jgi:hypothetical protein
MKPGTLVKNKLSFDDSIGIVMDVKDKSWAADTLANSDPHALVKYPNERPRWELAKFLEVISA